MVYSSDALIAVSDAILNSFTELNKLEYSKKGRVYRYVNNNFQRIREEDKHLVIYPQDISMNVGQASAFNILRNINDGQILNDFPDFCCSILGVAQQLEANKWYEIENSSVIHYNNCKFDPLDCKAECDEWLSYHPIAEQHILTGIDLLYCAKLNFLHTDHHIGTKIEGYYMKHYLSRYGNSLEDQENDEHHNNGLDIFNSPDILVALKSFVHWGNIKGILYKLAVPNINISSELKENFEDFPAPSEELKLAVYDRYPSGTSKYSLIRKSIDILGDWEFSKLLPFPSDIELSWLYELCHDIEKNPLKYHLRSKSKELYVDPINLLELSQLYQYKCQVLLNLISLIFNVFKSLDIDGDFLLNNSKIPKFNENLIQPNLNYYNILTNIRDLIQDYTSKSWTPDDIILRLQHNNDSLTDYTCLFDKVMAMREKFIEDYE
ncbi:hypothetical protein DFJ63DRAFT_315289 [Scheffersomyces coipomensis]|uniref:uncharacterized protein n=1 Tax=Scheffersomyces coipomensis TaxID=1788519 RepID=UPI00315C8C23